MRWEVEQEVYSQMPPDNDGVFTLNPIAKALGPVQKELYHLLIVARAVQVSAAARPSSSRTPHP